MRVFYAVYFILYLLSMEALYNYRQEVRKQLEKEREEFTKVMEQVGRTFVEMGLTAEQAGQMFHEFAEAVYNMADVSWHSHQLSWPRDIDEEGSLVGEFAPVEVYEHLCWRCMVLLEDDEEDFGLCKDCRQELEDL